MVRKGLLILGILLAPWASLAHPLGNFSLSHYTSIQVERDAVALRYALDLAEIPTFQELQASGIVPEVGYPNLPGYLARQTVVLQEGLWLEVDGQRLPLQGVASEILFPPGACGLPTLKLGLQYRAPLAPLPAAGHQLSYRGSNFPGRAGWQEIIAVAGAGVTVVQSSVPATDRSQALTDYPTDLCNSPPQVREAQVVFTLAPPPQEVAVVDTPTPPALTANREGTPRSPFTNLVTPPQLRLGVVCLALAVAAGLGACYAIEPGHGKTMVAAYMVGTRGTVWHILLLGLIVTATHTAGVYVLGAITLYASHYVIPERLHPWFGVFSGLAIAGLGGWLGVRRYAGQVQTYTHSHDHAHAPEPTHAPTPTPASAPTYAQSHSRHQAHGYHDHEAGQTVSCRALLTLGVAGGMVPCPVAPVVLPRCAGRAVGKGWALDGYAI